MSVQVNRISIFVDGSPCLVSPGQSLLRACLSAGFNVPYFCWHPALESVGACRQCAVKLFRDEKDTRGRIVMSCMTQVVDGMRISLVDPEVIKFRASNIEWLMLNHPHDCPVCDEGGECHLQDMTVMTGHTYRRTRFRKRTYENQYLGPFINHEMNRCIQCYRCLRFYRDYAGGRDFHVFGSHDRIYFGRHSEGTLESSFSGNLVEICPTGVFTDKTEKRHFARKWDLETAPSVCVHCGVGCNTIPGERSGELRRIRNRFNGSVNGYFLCDRGRFGYEFVNSPDRVLQPLMRSRENDSRNQLEGEAAVRHLAGILSSAKGVVGVGSPRASLESNFALSTLVGPERFFAGIQEREFGLVSCALGVMRNGPVRSASLAEVASSDAVLVLGEDIANTAPMIALNVLQACRNRPIATMAEKLDIPHWEDRATREAIQQAKGPFFMATTADTRLDDRAEIVFRGAPDDIARLGFAVAHFLDEGCPGAAGPDDRVTGPARAIAEALRTAASPLVVSGPGAGSVYVIEAAANVALALSRCCSDPRLLFVAPECDSIGLALMSAHGVDGALAAVEKGEADTMIILENDLLRRADKDRVRACLGALRQVVLLDYLFHEAAFLADLILPVGTFAEATGTLVNNEGRAQRSYQVFVPRGDVRPAWKWIRDAMAVLGLAERAPWGNLDDLIAAMAREIPVLGPMTEIAPSAGFRVAGLKIPREPHRWSGRTAIGAHINVHEPKPVDDPDSPLAFSMEGYQGRPPAPLISRIWAPGWNSVQALNKFQAEVGGSLVGGDPGRRLMEPGNGKEPRYFTEVPRAFAASESLIAVPLHHVFGSEELSMFSPSIAHLAPRPYVMLSHRDAALLGLADGDEALIAVAHATGQWRASVVVRAGFPEGIAGLPSGLPGLETVKGGKIDVRKVPL